MCFEQLLLSMVVFTHPELGHNILTTVMRNIIVDKNTDSCLPQYSTLKKVFISERDQNHDTKKEQAVSITFS